MKPLPTFLLALYTYFLFKILVFKDLPEIQIGHLHINFGGTQGGEGNWIPFKTIIPYVLGAKGLLIGGLNIVGNIVLLIPIGYLVPFVFRSLNWNKTIVFAIVFCGLIETIQSIFKIGIFDIDDVILNVLGVLIGYLAFTLPTKIVMISSVICLAIAIYFVYPMFALSQRKPRANHPLSDKKLSKKTQLDDLCGGTGGIGTIVKIEAKGFDLTQKNGKLLHVRLAPKAEIKSSSGTISLAQLKVGQAVTLVGGPESLDGFLADLVLVCQ
jgi:glycopeptide antibiotics resistance protein